MCPRQTVQCQLLPQQGVIVKAGTKLSTLFHTGLLIIKASPTVRARLFQLFVELARTAGSLCHQLANYGM